LRFASRYRMRRTLALIRACKIRLDSAILSLSIASTAKRTSLEVIIRIIRQRNGIFKELLKITCNQAQSNQRFLKVPENVESTTHLCRIIMLLGIRASMLRNSPKVFHSVSVTYAHLCPPLTDAVDQYARQDQVEDVE